MGDRNGVQLRRRDANRQVVPLPPNWFDITQPCLGTTWHTLLFRDEFKKHYFHNLCNALNSMVSVYPRRQDLFKWTTYFGVEETKVIIVGQSPCEGLEGSDGLAFSVRRGTPQPRSLCNIYKELESEGFNPTKLGSLEGLAGQGVLLLNSILTADDDDNQAKYKIWLHLTDAVVSYLSNNYTNLVFLLWGNVAKEKESLIDKDIHCVYTTNHPSGLSAGRGFLGCNHFRLPTNTFLESIGESEIDWDKA